MKNLLQKYKKALIISILVIANASVAFFILSTSKTEKNTSAEQVREGKDLASQYCQSCHMLPDPSLLTKEIWATRVMLHMGPFLGITSFKGVSYMRANDVNPAEYFPSTQVVDSIQWEKIIDYYVSKAPAQMPEQKKEVAVIKNLPIFSIQYPDSSFFGKVSMSPFVKIDTSEKPNKLLVVNGDIDKLFVFNEQLKVIKTISTKGPIVDLDFQKDGILACSIGKNLIANNLKDGKVYPISLMNNGQLKTEPKFDSLARPCKLTHADLNGDGKVDYIISQFGNLVGNLTWMENLGNGKYIPHLLRDKPGPMTTIVNDYNHDGLTDVWALFGQGEEGVFLFTNKGNGKFEEKQVLRFPPSFGSVYFDLVDFNHDGFLDIIYTAGDNGDFTDILKPYHGVYIFLNDGKNNFSQKYFYPINGCFKAIARDFDGDGNIDIATISFYPSSLELEESFIFLKNKGDFKFQPYSLPEGSRFQKGISMDVGDIDNDGKLDLILGNGFYTSSKEGPYKEPLFLVLKNISGQKKN